jgi:hypothetical protein
VHHSSYAGDPVGGAERQLTGAPSVVLAALFILLVVEIKKPVTDMSTNPPF